MNINIGGSIILTLLIAAVVLLAPMIFTENPQSVYEQINELRAEHGLSALVWDNQLAVQAQAHSEWMKESGSFNHSSHSVYECINMGGSSVESWMNSPPHLAILLSPNITRCGVGIAGQYATFQAV